MWSYVMRGLVLCVLVLFAASEPEEEFIPFVTTIAGGDEEGHVDGGGIAGGTSVRFYNPTGIDVTPDDQFAIFCDRSNHVIRHYDIYQDVVVTMAGNSSEEGDVDADHGLDARFKQPYSLKVHPNGTYALIVDPYTKSIRMMNVSAPHGVRTVASGFQWPTSIAIARNGSFAALTDRNTVMLMNLTTFELTTLAGKFAEGNSMGIGTHASFKQPAGIAIAPDGSVLYVIDYNNHHVRSVTIPEGDAQRFCGQLTDSGTQVDGECLSTATLVNALDIVFAPDASYALFTDAETNTLRAINMSTNEVTTVVGLGTAGSADGTFSYATFDGPNSVAFLSDGNTIMVVTDDDKLRCVQLRESQLIIVFCTFPVLPDPTGRPSAMPTSVPSASPTAVPSSVPTAVPTTPFPSSVPTSVPTSCPSSIPTSIPTSSPSSIPSSVPSSIPTGVPTSSPSAIPTSIPTSVPSVIPTSVPSALPTSVPTSIPSAIPTSVPSAVPTSVPTSIPSAIPTSLPTAPQRSSSAAAITLVRAGRAGRWLLPILVALSLLCCCCFVLVARRRRKREEEKKVNPYEVEENAVVNEEKANEKVVDLES